MKVKIIKSGKNNLVKKIFFKKKIYIYKKYLKKSNNGIKYSRYSSETAFIKLLKKKNVKNLPTILNTNAKTQENIFNYIKGKKITKITNKDILQCVYFIKKINKDILNNKVVNFKYATEACLSIDNHIETAQRRIKMLLKFKKNFGIYKKTTLFVKNVLKKKLDQTKNNKYKSFSKKEILKKINKRDLILSPSDFGFHNIIKKKNKLFFFDFEYAGMDDPVKLISDFICQPDHKLNKNQSLFFYKNILRLLPKNNDINKRFNAVINLHNIK